MAHRRLKGYRLRFNLEGRPVGKAAPANICPDQDCELWGVLYRITRRELLRLDSTEGVPGRNYRHVLVPVEDADGNIVTAVTYMARGKETDGTPSFRYISLLRDGARAHGLPETWVRFLDSVQHHARVEHSSLPPPRIQRVAQPVADQVERQHDQEDRQAGKHREPRRLRQEALRRVQHRAPGRRRRLLAQTEERQARLGDDGRGDRQRALHQ